MTGEGPLFEWDEANAGHIAEHRIAPEEAEEALLDPQAMGAPAYNVPGERRQGVLGATEAGRVLFVVVTRREGAVRVVTARDAAEMERRRYRGR